MDFEIGPTGGVAPTTIMSVGYGGKVGIGTTSPAQPLHIKSNGAVSYNGATDLDGESFLTLEGTSADGEAAMIRWANHGGMNNYFGVTQVGANGQGDFVWTSYNGSAYAERMRITSDGKVSINTTATDAFLNSYANGTNIKAAMFQSLGGNKLSIAPYISNGAFSSLSHVNDIAIIAESAGGIVIAHAASGNKGIRIVDNGDLEVGGALSKASGSFKIDHPLESKKDTHHLVHSFVEAPQADNIYRGVVTLVNGSATINLDTEAGMTEGTYTVLNTNTSCFTSNETDWDAVKGSVSGNILTISCQNTSSTATVSWLVIGERHDQHMLDTEWTNENGKVIVEPLKRVIEDE
jgi:hypothetical protein